METQKQETKSRPILVDGVLSRIVNVDCMPTTPKKTGIETTIEIRNATLTQIVFQGIVLPDSLGHKVQVFAPEKNGLQQHGIYDCDIHRWYFGDWAYVRQKTGEI